LSRSYEGGSPASLFVAVQACREGTNIEHRLHAANYRLSVARRAIVKMLAGDQAESANALKNIEWADEFLFSCAGAIRSMYHELSSQILVELAA
jgi:hypothetical protein